MFSIWHNKRRIITPKTIWQRLHFDIPLLLGIIILTGVGLIILYSAANQNMGMVTRQVTRLGIAYVVMLLVAQIPPRQLAFWTPALFGMGVILLIAVLLVGHTGKGAQRWLNLGVIRFQPSELMKLSIPMMAAWIFKDKLLPPKNSLLAVAACLIILPVLLTAKQPDLGTALMLACSGFLVLLLAGLSWRWIIAACVAALAGAPIVWHFMRAYQQQRVLTFLNPERDPLGSGYHIIQSKIAIGSGGFYGKGWLNGTQSHLHFLPEHATDFIFAVCGEEFGLLGGIALLAIYLYITGRGLYISTQAQDTYTRLLAGSISLTFFISVFVNIGMVTGILPVVGLPLPLISYGGTSMVTIFASFGILMSIHTHRKLIGG